MQLIRKSEEFALRENGYSNYVKKTFSRKPKYYVVESFKALQFLVKYRESIRIK